LVGAALWGARRAASNTQSTFPFPRYNKADLTNNNSEFAFSSYNDGQRTNSNSASAALNKWLKGKIGLSYTIHSFRHSMRDRLRAVECPSNIIDQISGWLTYGVGNAYGSGFKITALYKWIQQSNCS